MKDPYGQRMRVATSTPRVCCYCSRMSTRQIGKKYQKLLRSLLARTTSHYCPTNCGDQRLDEFQWTYYKVYCYCYRSRPFFSIQDVNFLSKINSQVMWNSLFNTLIWNFKSDWKFLIWFFFSLIVDFLSNIQIKT